MRTQVSAPRHRGFTLFELLVLLALLAILLGLLLPAVARVRMAARRTEDQSLLRQLGRACRMYHDVNGALPPGVDANHFSATARVLPYIAQDNVYKLIHFDKDLDDRANDQARALVVKMFLSPGDPILAAKKETGATNYPMSAGSKHSLEDNDGVFFKESKVRFADVTDGLSNTLMAGETLKGDGGTKGIDVNRQHVLLKEGDLKGLKDEAGVKDFKDNKNIAGDRCASWMDGRFLQGTFTATRKLNDPRPDVSCGGAGGLSALRSLNVQVNVLFCDGSVRSLRTGMEMDVLKALATRNGGEAIRNDF
jgi:prepilin-type processing-associated H-X9-DG protein